MVVKQRIRDLIKRINRESRVTVFLTSHDAGDIEKICRRVMVINQGTALWQGTVKEMKYSLLNKRIIDVKLENPLHLPVEGVKVLKNLPYASKLEVDLNRVSMETLMGHLIRNNTIQDITISPIPMEELISLIYQGAV